jgi:hypothetical protein
MAGKHETAMSGGVVAGATFESRVTRRASISAGAVARDALTAAVFDEVARHLAAAQAAYRAGDVDQTREYVRYLYKSAGKLKRKVGRRPKGQDAQAYIEERMANGSEYDPDLIAEAARKTGLSRKTCKRWGDKIQR